MKERRSETNLKKLWSFECFRIICNCAAFFVIPMQLSSLTELFLMQIKSAIFPDNSKSNKIIE